MAKSRTYVVSFCPAEKQPWGGYTVKISLMTGGTNHEVTASDYDELDRAVRKLAHEYGQTCSPYIRLKDRNERKPAGFDKFCKGLNIIELEASPDAAKEAA